MKVKIRKIGNSLGILLPKDVLSLLNLQNGDEIDLNLEDKKISLVLKNH